MSHLPKTPQVVNVKVGLWDDRLQALNYHTTQLTLLFWDSILTNSLSYWNFNPPNQHLLHYSDHLQVCAECQKNESPGAHPLSWVFRRNCSTFFVWLLHCNQLLISLSMECHAFYIFVIFFFFLVFGNLTIYNGSQQKVLKCYPVSYVQEGCEIT
jgi:hypothetical protein